jgi:proton-dependent oligopeptide transporter, POT family
MGLAKHPKGLYVLFFAEMWERFSFYSMLAMFTLYLKDDKQGFGWSAAEATRLYAWYMTCVYASPLVGGLIADRALGYRRSVMLGGLFFIAGHLLLSFHNLNIVYLALGCLVIGNGFFKPNVSTMVGNLYPKGSPLKDQAYNIFYMGINIGAFLGPVVMAVVQHYFGYHPAFAVAAFGMLLSVITLWALKRHIEDEARGPAGRGEPAAAVSHPIDAIPDWKRVVALVVVFAIVIVFWMVFHQNGSTLSYWADDNTDWKVSGIISNAINPFWVVTLTFPLVAFWGWLNRRGLEPSTPTKMAIGMTLTALSFAVLYAAARGGETAAVTPEQYARGDYRITERALDNLRAEGVSEEVLAKLGAKDANDTYLVRDKKFATDDESSGRQKLVAALLPVLGSELTERHETAVVRQSYLFKVSPLWLFLSYAVVTLGELMLSPMGLSLVSKVAPGRMRGLMMGGWFVATALGNKLTAIGVYWDIWLQSNFFAVLGGLALVMAAVLFLLLRPLKKAMPGV